MPKYKLTRRFYDGERLHEVGEVLDFVEGCQPRLSRQVSVGKREVEEIIDDDEEPLLFEDKTDLTQATAGSTLSGLAKGRK